MSLTVANSAQISLHQANKSPTKQIWSFAKADRFGARRRKNQNEKIGYDLPTTLSKRGTSFGYGSRKNFAINNGVPPPNTYKAKSNFQKNPPTKAFSFGIA